MQAVDQDVPAHDVRCAKMGRPKKDQGGTWLHARAVGRVTPLG